MLTNYFDHIQKAELARSLGKFELAEKHLKEAISEEPNYSTAWRVLSRLRIEQENPKEALKAIETAIAIRPDEASNHAQLGVCLSVQKEFKLAGEAYYQAVKLAPTDARWFGLLAHHCFVVKSYHESVEYAKAGLEINPKELNCLGAIAMSNAKIGKRKEAISYADQLLSENPNNVGSLQRVSKVYQELGMSSKGQKYLGEALKMKPNTKSTHAQLRYLLLMKVYPIPVLIGFIAFVSFFKYLIALFLEYSMAQVDPFSNNEMASIVAFSVVIFALTYLWSIRTLIRFTSFLCFDYIRKETDELEKRHMLICGLSWSIFSVAAITLNWVPITAVLVVVLLGWLAGSISAFVEWKRN